MDILTNCTNKENKELCSILSKLKSLFEYYCQNGDRLNFKYLNSFKYDKLLTVTGIIPTIDKIKTELIYKTECQSNTMTFYQFLNTLIPIAKLIYSSNELNERQSLARLINNYLIPQSDKLAYETSNGKIPNIEKEIRKDNVIDKLINVSPLFFEIYSSYFKHEISICDKVDFIKEESLKKYYIFLKDYEILPGIISKTMGLKVYRSETSNEQVESLLQRDKDYYYSLLKKIDLEAIKKNNKKNNNVLGQYFTFFKFIRVMLKIADLSFQKIKLDTREAEFFNDQIKTYYDKLMLFLQKIELSQGFIDLNRKTAKNRNKNTMSFFYNESKTNTNSTAMDSTYRKRTSADIVMGRSFNYDKINNKINLLSYHNNLKDICNYSDYILSIYGEALYKIFIALCQFGTSTTTKKKTLNSKQFFKMLLNCSLVNISKDNSDYCHSNGISYYYNKLEPFDIDTLIIKLSNIPAYNDNNDCEHTDNCIETGLMSNNKPNNSTSFDFSLHNNSNILLHKDTFLQTSLNIKNKYLKAPINSSVSITYDVFIIGIEVLSSIIYPSIPIKEAIDILIKDNIIPNMISMTQSNEQFDFLYAELNKIKTEITNQQLLHTIANNFTCIYYYYSRDNEYMTFDQLLSFAKDFNCFPGIISMKKLKKLFFKLSHKSIVINEIQKEVLDYNAFIDILCLCGMLSNTTDINTIDKIIGFIDKLVIDEGIKKLLQKGGGVNRVQYINTQHWVLNNNLPLSKQQNKSFNKDNKVNKTFFDIFMQNS